MSGDDLEDQLLSHAHQILSYVRDKSIRAYESEITGQDPGESEAEQLWKDVYGTFQVSGASPEELSKKLSELFTARLAGAGVVIADLAMRIAKAENVSLVDVLDQTRDRLEATAQAMREGRSDA